MNVDVLRLCQAVRDAGGRAMLVGGWVRDRLLGLDSKNFDVEVYGIEPERLRAILEKIGQVNTVGEHFSVYKLVSYQPSASNAEQSSDADPAQPQRFEIDVSLPRRESKSGRGHRGFVIEGDPSMSFGEAARRRDFTINAIIYDPLTDETIDPYDGATDLQRRILRAVAADTFIEDSLRVLRAVQLVARFEVTLDHSTVELCRSIDLSDLPRERIWGEIEKLLTLAERPSLGLDAALELRVLDQLFPEIRMLLGRRLSGDEDSFDHTKRSLDVASTLAGDLSKPKRVAVMLAALAHEPGQITTATTSDSEPTHSILNRLGVYTLDGYNVRAQVMALVREQRNPAEFYARRQTIPDGDFRRLAQKVDMDLLARVAKSCALARKPEPSSIAEDWFLERSRALGVEHGPPAPLLQGRHLLDAGYEPGPQMGKLLRSVYELQLDGEVTTTEEALAAARRFAV
jgi:tRNA nucleotidyltransferase (CCA-adding enzyme)